MDCLHRFCRECIDKSMRLGYELAFHEEEKTRNKEIQASIAQIFQRQTEARTGKDAGFIRRPQRNLRNTNSRRKRNSRAAELHAYEDNEEDNNGGKDSSSADERPTEVRQRKKGRRTGARSSRASSSADGGCAENETEATRESQGISPGLVWNPEMLAWGKGGTRSNTRHGGANGGSKNSRHARLSKLTEHLRGLEETDEADIYFMLISVDKKTTPSLKLPYVRIRSSLSVGHLREYVACQTALQADEVEILVLKSPRKPNVTRPTLASGGIHSSPDVNISKEELQLVEERETLANIRAKYSSTHNNLILAYRQKKNPAAS
ncbi:hypothetical protein CRG98_028273 [Punica granatum]|uniref:E3 ubiquitin-protein ligase RING1a n=1 Tax=Punica granatum TaxID=22663 RepID=A0A2I0J6J7_PUNGR|nr:hypothetical protein CRG98_028273 [Punica granatum]